MQVREEKTRGWVMQGACHGNLGGDSDNLAKERRRETEICGCLCSSFDI